MKRRIHPRRLALIAAGLLVAYAGLSAAFYRWMVQPPGAFAAHMARLPVPLQYAAMMVLPFESMWRVARAGRLRPGAPAPDFSLPRLGRGEQGPRPEEPVRLSVYRGARPVVLVFGSYT